MGAPKGPGTYLCQIMYVFWYEEQINHGDGEREPSTNDPERELGARKKKTVSRCVNYRIYVVNWAFRLSINSPMFVYAFCRFSAVSMLRKILFMTYDFQVAHVKVALRSQSHEELINSRPLRAQRHQKRVSSSLFESKTRELTSHHAIIQ